MGLPRPPLFGSFSFFQFYRKNCRRKRDSNSFSGEGGVHADQLPITTTKYCLGFQIVTLHNHHVKISIVLSFELWPAHVKVSLEMAQAKPKFCTNVLDSNKGRL